MWNMVCKEGQLDVVNYMILNNQIQGFWYQFCLKSTHENWARGNRKTLKCLKMTTKPNFRTLKLKSHEEYLTYRTYYVKQKT